LDEIKWSRLTKNIVGNSPNITGYHDPKNVYIVINNSYTMLKKKRKEKKNKNKNKKGKKQKILHIHV
jgi:hypothetical protein